MYKEINTRNILRHVKDSTYFMAGEIERFKDKPFEDIPNFTNFQLAFFICELKKELYEKDTTFNFYFPFEYRYISKYLINFEEIFLAMPSYEVKLFKLCTGIQALVDDTFERITDFSVENLHDVIKVLDNYINGEFALKKQRILFEKKLDPALNTDDYILTLIESEVLTTIRCHLDSFI